MAKSLALSELIEQVKADLLRPRTGAEPALFAISEVEVQVSFTVERAANGGIDLQVVQLGASGASSATHSATIRLVPLVTPEEVRAGIDQAARGAVQRVVMRGEDSSSAAAAAAQTLSRGGESGVVRRGFNDLAES
jgi:hypothetical protein